MKKRIILTVLVVLIICVLVSCIVPFYRVRNFCLDDYSEFLNAPVSYSEPHLGKINNASEARSVAKKVFKEVYAEYFMAATFPYIVSYDSQNDIWLVQAGKCFIPEWGAHIVINASDGKILGLWNYKF